MKNIKMISMMMAMFLIFSTLSVSADAAEAVNTPLGIKEFEGWNFDGNIEGMAQGGIRLVGDYHHPASLNGSEDLEGTSQLNIDMKIMPEQDSESTVIMKDVYNRELEILCFENGKIVSNHTAITTFVPEAYLELSLMFDFPSKALTIVYDNKEQTVSFNKDTFSFDQVKTVIFRQQNGSSQIESMKMNASKADAAGSATKLFISNSAIEEKIRNLIVMAVDIPYAAVHGKRTPVAGQEGRPLLERDRVFIPVRFIAESLGGGLEWNEQDQSIDIVINRQKINIKIGSRDMTMDSEKILLDAAPEMMNGLSMIPLDFLEKINQQVTFNQNKNLVILGDTKKAQQIMEDNDFVGELKGYLTYARPTAAQMLEDLQKTNPNKGHPRIMATAQTFENIKNNIGRDQYVTKFFNDVKDDADKRLGQGVPTYVKSDDTRLDASYAVKDRVIPMAMAYKVTGDPKYAERIWKDIEATSKFSDWNPDHFLDVATMSEAYAIAYDWLYDYWNEEQKAVFIETIKKNSLNAILSAYYSGAWWVKVNHNWNAVCNGGVSVAALAFFDDEPEIAGEVLETAIRCLESMLEQFKPDGAWIEGPGYWEYMTMYLVGYFSALQTALGSAYGYMDADGISQTGYFPAYLTGPEGVFNFSDATDAPINSPELFWLANNLHDDGLRNVRLNMIDRYDFTGSVRDLLWYQPQTENRATGEMPLDRYFRHVETTAFHSKWYDENEEFVGFRAGSNAENHDHLDVGNFVFDAMGERWALDLGGDNRNLPGYYALGKGGDAWKFYRARAEGHNTLVINPTKSEDQNVMDSYSEIIKYESKPQGAMAITGMTPAYQENAKQVLRGVKLFDNREQFMVQDEVETYSPSEIYWFMHTKADIKVSEDGKTAILQKNGKQVKATLLAPFNGKFTVMDAVPLPSSPVVEGQNPNKGVRKLTIHLTNVTTTQISVVLSPLYGGDQPENVPSVPQDLASWSIPDGGLERADTAITIDGKPFAQFSKQQKMYNYFVKEDENGEFKVPDIKAESAKVTLPEAVPGVVKIQAVQGNVISTYYINLLRVNKDNGGILILPSDVVKLKIAGYQVSDVPQPENPPEAMVDGDLNTRWSAEGEQWLVLDLGEAKKVGYVCLAFMNGSDRITNFDIETSTDGQTWSFLSESSSSGKTDDPEPFLIDRENVRFVRLDFHGNSVNAWNSITEVELYN